MPFLRTTHSCRIVPRTPSTHVLLSSLSGSNKLRHHPLMPVYLISLAAIRLAPSERLQHNMFNTNRQEHPTRQYLPNLVAGVLAPSRVECAFVSLVHCVWLEPSLCRSFAKSSIPDVPRIHNLCVLNAFLRTDP